MSSVLSEREALYLGALLHDVGKFSQRANANEKFIKHQYLSAAVVERLLGNDTVNFIVAHHHKEDLDKSPETGKKRLLARIVYEADNLASGERLNENSVLEQELLRSIFSAVSLETGYTAPVFRQPFSNLTPSHYQMPVEKSYNNVELRQGYEAHWKKFSQELERLDDSDADTLTYLYKKYLWCMPSSSYKTTPDISLYEHSRLVAAIALCLYDNLNCAKENVTEQLVLDRTTQRYRLLCGDITGIQSYIYGIAHKGALKALKGRSFLLQHLCTSFAEHYMQNFDLPLVNILYASGGKFYALLPETPDTGSKLADIEAGLQRDLLLEYDGALGFISASLTLCGNDFVRYKTEPQKPLGIVKAWEKVGKDLEKQKHSPFTSLLKQSSFFEPFGVGGNVLRCYATGKELCVNTPEEIQAHLGTTVFRYSDDSETADKYISREQHTSRRIGEALRNADALHVVRHGSAGAVDIPGWKSFVLGGQNTATGSAAYLLNNDDFISLPAPKRGWRFYGGNWMFESDLDELEAKAKGIKRLGILRMDVDNLGEIFAKGLGDNATFSRVVQLSSMLDFFFSSYLNCLQTLHWSIEAGVNEKQGDKLDELLSIVYAGGDDVCIIGVWNVLPDVALWIEREFRAYVGNNKCFTLSAGIAVFSGKFPIVKAAGLAGDAEAIAKGKRLSKNRVEKSKNALCFFGTPMSWEDVRIIREWVGKFAIWIEKGSGQDTPKLNRGFIQRLHRIYAEYINGKGELWAQWRWRAAYSLARFGEQNKDYNNVIQKFSAECLTGESSLCPTEKDFIALTGVIARWTEYLTRSE